MRLKRWCVVKFPEGDGQAECLEMVSGKSLVEGSAGSYICHWPKVDDIKVQRMILKDVDIQNMECDPFDVDLIYSSGTLHRKIIHCYK